MPLPIKFKGGWVSPAFAPSIDRGWLEKDEAQPHFHPSAFVPQPGDTVLYYPTGHKDFLKKYPDHLALKKISRAPLWERAVKERNKAGKSKAKDEDAETGGKNNSSTMPWWTEEWLSQESLLSYPLVCRVEKTQAEFPPDPTPRVNGTWVLSDINARTKGKKKAVLRLAVSLRPLTPLLPPSWTSSGPVEIQNLCPPPPFTAVTFPSSLPAFMLPFSWAFVHNHTFTIDDDVMIAQSKTTFEKGKIRSFETLPLLDKEFGNFRIDDKLDHIANIVGLTNSHPSQVVDDGKEKARAVSTIPPQDMLTISEFLVRVLRQNDRSPKERSEQSDTKERGDSEMSTFIRSTLPLWKSVCVMRDVLNRKTFNVCAWDLKTLKPRLKEDVEFGVSTRTLDSVLADKIELTIHDFLNETPQAEPFRPLVTDEIAQYYNSAVPISMSFNRIIRRLKQKKSANGIQSCYYRTFEAVMADVNAIQDNCSLYNSPESDIVGTANIVIPGAKKALTALLSNHIKEYKDKIKREEEKRRFLAAVVSSDPAMTRASEGRRAQNNAVDPFREPFKAPLYRDWLQLCIPDIPWKTGSKKHQENDNPQWVPQAGDSVLYSRELHMKFVEGHYDSLAINQCFIPQPGSGEEPKTGNNNSDDAWKDGGKANPSNGVGIAELHVKEETLQHSDSTSGSLDAWEIGNVVSIRAEFPRPPKSGSKSSDDNDGAFMTDSPVLAVAIQFPAVASSKPSVIYWRPCSFSCDVQRSGSGNENCMACGVPLATSFLRPSWINQYGENHPERANQYVPQRTSPEGIPTQEIQEIEVGLSLLKRRCMNRIPTDYCDPDLTIGKFRFCIHFARLFCRPKVCSEGL